jgi:hypothetical protein
MTPEDIRRAALEEAARVAERACLVPPDGGSPTPEEVEVANRAAADIRALSGPAPVSLPNGLEVQIGGAWKLVYKEEFLNLAGPVKGLTGNDRRLAQLLREAWNKLPDTPSIGGPSTTAPDPWRTIESAPKDGTHILVAYPLFDKGNLTDKPDEYAIMIVRWKDRGWDTGFWCLHETPRGWQPLPAPPKEGT